MIEEKVVKKLIERNESVSSMESCTAGYFATTITNVEGSSNVFCFSAITYSDEYKIRLGVNKDIIKKYGVYSTQTAREMAKIISFFAESTYGVGITGTLKPYECGKSEIYVSIYNNKNYTFCDFKLKFINKKREKSKQLIVNKTLLKLFEMIN